MPDTQDFRSAMARLGAAVNIITTDGPEGRHGMVASAVCSVSDEPATLLVCINRSSRMNALIKGNGRYAVNVLTARQEDFSRVFTDRSLSVEERFDRTGPWTAVAGTLPALSEALAVVGCRVETVTEVGTHTLFLGRVEEIFLGDEQEEGLVYFGRRYHALAARLEAGA